MKRILVAVFLLIILALPSQARADMAPPGHPPGSNPEPGSESTQVRMLAETVVIDVRPGASDKSLGQAHVTADFTMHNLSEVDENMAARFPIGSSDGYFRVNELRDLQIKVAGKRVATRRILGEDPYHSSTQVPWAEFDVTFPAGQDTSVEVEYTLEASGEYPFIWFKYILSSGAGWKDTIGSADIIVRLPYEANLENVLFDTDMVWFGTTRDGILDGNEIRWHSSDLEPTTENNFEVNLVMPSAWERLLVEQKNVAQNPRDGEAWGRLGKLCKQMAFSSRGKGFRSAGTLDSGGAELYQLSLKAYDQAVTLLPKDALWHAGYADLLSYHAYVDAFNGANTDEEALHSIREIHAALELAPNDPQVLQIAERIAAFFHDGIQHRPNSKAFLFLWLTATPSPSTPTVPPTEVSGIIQASETPAKISTSTPEIKPTAQETQTPASKPSLPFCGATMFLPAMLAALAFARSGGKIKRK